MPVRAQKGAVHDGRATLGRKATRGGQQTGVGGKAASWRGASWRERRRGRSSATSSRRRTMADPPWDPDRRKEIVRGSARKL
jgi:hypothetical protein